jgi:hypothetical protein
LCSSVSVSPLLRIVGKKKLLRFSVESEAAFKINLG